MNETMNELIDVTESARNQAAIPEWRVSVSPKVWERCVSVPKGAEGQSEGSRLHDLLAFLGYHLKQAPVPRYGEIYGGFAFCVNVVNDRRKRSEQPDGVEWPGTSIPLAAFASIGPDGAPSLIVLARSETPLG